MNDPEADAAVKEQLKSRLAHDFSWREDVLESISPYYDRFGNGPHPTRLTAHSFASLVPGLLHQFSRQRVPDEMTTVDLNDEGFSVIEVTCRCGQIHEIEIGGILDAECGRIFAWFGRGVMWAMPEASAKQCTCTVDEKGYEFLDLRCPVCCSPRP